MMIVKGICLWIIVGRGLVLVSDNLRSEIGSQIVVLDNLRSDGSVQLRGLCTSH